MGGECKNVISTGSYTFTICGQIYGGLSCVSRDSAIPIMGNDDRFSHTLEFPSGWCYCRVLTMNSNYSTVETANS